MPVSIETYMRRKKQLASPRAFTPLFRRRGDHPHARPVVTKPEYLPDDRPDNKVKTIE